jgi:haloacetate dehalogenase
MCEDYRAAASLDLRLDHADKAAGKRIHCPLQVLWAQRGLLERCYDVLAIWRDWADQVEGHAIDCGHFLPEEAPEPTYQALTEFLDRRFPGASA